MNRLKEIRKQKGLTLNEVGKKVGVKNNTLSQYENNKREPRLETWQKLAEFYEVSVPYLQGIDDFYYDSEMEKIIGGGSIDLKDLKNINPKYVKKIVSKKLNTIKELIDQLTLIRSVNYYLDNKENGAKPIYKSVTNKELNDIGYLKEHFDFVFSKLSLNNKDKIIENVFSGETAKKIANLNNNEFDSLFDEISSLNMIHDVLENEIDKEISKYSSKTFFDGAKDFILNKQFDVRTNNLTNDLFLTLMGVLAKLDEREIKNSRKARPY